MNAIHRTAATVFLSLLASGSAFCNLGETPEEVEARYGRGEEHRPARFLDTIELQYKSHGFDIFVFFLHGKSIKESFKHITRKFERMPDRLIEELLKEYSSGRPWEYSDRDKIWSFENIVAYRESGHPDWFWFEYRETFQPDEKRP